MNQVDLFVVGSDFYSGSTLKKGRLKDGWCDFRALGNRYVGDYFGTSQVLGHVWYLATRVLPGMSRAFEEHERQRIWLDALDLSATRVIIDSRAPVMPLLAGSGVDFGTELRYRTQEAAISALRTTPLAPQAMVIAADGEEDHAPLLSLLHEKYERNQLTLVPPDFEMHEDGNIHLSHQDLEAARLSHEGDWRSYARSKDRGELAATYFRDTSAELRPRLVRRLAASPWRVPSRWRERVHQDNLPDISGRVARFLLSQPRMDRTLAKDPNLISFIARKLIDSAADLVITDRIEQDFTRPGSSIANGSDLVQQAPEVFPKIEICDSAEKQILSLTGNERYFRWIVEALTAANQEIQSWTEGPFPHGRLPGPASGESPSVKNSPKLRNLRCFKTLRGEKLLFEHHMKNHKDNVRVYYRVDSDRRVLMVGYVGKHPDSALY